MLNLNKSTRYALYAAMEMASARGEEPITAADTARRYGVPGSVLAKVFQQLVRGGIAIGERGSHGGYRLARDPAELTILDVVEAMEPGRGPGTCLLEDSEETECSRTGDCRLFRVFEEVDELARSTFASITLETLVRSPRPGRQVSLHKP